MKIVQVLSWKYSDGSSYGIIGVYATKESADDMLKILTFHGDTMKTFIVEPIEFFGEQS